MSEFVILQPLLGCPDIKQGDDLRTILLNCVKNNQISLQDQDIICVAQKVVSKAEGCQINLKKVDPSDRALFYSEVLNKDARKIEVILKESSKIVRYFKHEERIEGTLICKHKLGFISANAGVDESNIEGEDTVLVLPKDPDLSAKAIRDYLKEKCGVNIGIVITDTFGRPWRVGQVNVAIGLAGLPATIKERGRDAYGRALSVTEPAFCDEISAASGLVMKKSEKTPFVFMRGLKWNEVNHTAADVVREVKEDMFL